ncbi:MAG: NAD(P)/FAD-dependent oxidoreductase [Elusimicrobia bacterium CG_4_10_14_0_8_um_filter_37_32]|nr:MAG: NAD(P)/FAD-dependent oxidoreductase [Elusimicrobia bacterium CG02_land_8_20_14_3_00_37_13]PIZ13512.1 MAG: NAD(P)/FAD-dependent oxidoreductase [Elusimicrobia bacterium CG_4_10_14_0_8_um_filter_37_32]
METKYLIIGNSIAGVSCIEGIREIDSKGKITVVSDESILNYSRPLISYYLGNKIPREKISFRDKNFYKENNVAVLLKTKALKIDTAKKEIRLNTGNKIKFQKLLIATGGKPIVPPIEGLKETEEGVFTFTNFSDTQKLINYIDKHNIKEALVLGAGLIGLKCTEGLIEKGLKVTAIELADRILANTFDKDASDILERALNKYGCTIIKENTIVKIKTLKGKIENIVLKSGKVIPAKLLIIAIGVVPNIDLLKITLIKYARGIIVNGFMETNVKNIYAAGDVAQGKDFLTRKNSVIAVWPVASYQGKMAGYNMAGKVTKYKGLFAMNSVELAGIPTISFGMTNPPKGSGYEVLINKDKIENNIYRKIVLKDNRIVGTILLGKIDRAGIIWGLIKEKINADSFKKSIISDDFGLLILPEEYRKHIVTGEGIEV